MRKFLFLLLTVAWLPAQAQISQVLGFTPAGTTISISAPNGSSSASTTLPGASASSTIQVYNSGTVPITIQTSRTPGGATASILSTVVGVSQTAYFFIGNGVSDIAVYGIGGTATVYIQAGNGGNTSAALTSTGAITPGDCVKFVNATVVQDSAGTCGGSGSPGGSNTQVQYNNNGAFGGSTYLTWNGSSNVFNVGASTTPGTVSVGVLDSMTVNGVAIPVPGFAINSNIQGVIENHSYVTGTGTGAARIYLARSDGTISAPTIVANGDNLGTIYAVGYGGVTGNYLTGGFMRFVVSGTPSSTAMPTDWYLNLAPVGGTTAANVIHAYNDTGVTFGAATGGDKGPGTVNMQGCYVNGVACTVGGGTTNFQVNGTALTSSTTVNFENSAAFNGLTFTFSNPSSGNVQLGASGSLNLTGLSTQSANTVVCNPSNAGASPVACNPSQVIGVLNSATANAQTGTTYNFALSDANGQVTMNNAAANTITLPPQPLSAPTQSALSTSTTGGTLAAGTYYYVVTATNAFGQTIASNEQNITTTGTTSSNTVTWGAITGATGYRIYRGTAAAGENVYYTVGAVTTYLDTNATSTAGTPPGSNTTGVAFPVGTLLTVQQIGAGLTTLSPGLNITIDSPQYGASTTQTYTLGGIYGYIQIQETALNTWNLIEWMTPVPHYGAGSATIGGTCTTSASTASALSGSVTLSSAGGCTLIITPVGLANPPAHGFTGDMGDQTQQAYPTWRQTSTTTSAVTFTVPAGAAIGDVITWGPLGLY